MTAPLQTTPSTQSTGLVVQARPAHICFEVKGITQLATKVNEAVQYIFKVEFHPSGHPATATQEKFEAEIPLHASTITEALMILQAYGNSIKNQTPQQFHETLKKMTYSAVLIEARAGAGYDVNFTQFNTQKQRFEKQPHVKTKITAKVYQELEAYAKDLESKHVPVGSGEVTPEVTLQQRSGEPHVEITLQATESTSSQTVTPQRGSTELLEQYERALRLAIQDEDGTCEKKKAAIEAYDKVFGEGFAAEVLAQGAAPKDLKQALFEEAQKRFKDLISQDTNKTAQVLEQLSEMERTEQQTPAGQTNYLLEQFFYMAEKMQKWKLKDL